MSTTVKRSEMWQRIKAARKRAGLTQLDVASALEIDRTAVTQWEARNPLRRTRPDIQRLEAFAEITRTPIWWLLSDEVDVLEPWPEDSDVRSRAVPTPSSASLIRGFWHEARLQTCTLRPDLWPAEVWDVDGPDWMRPILPEAMTARALVRWVEAPRIDQARIAALASSLLAFEVLQQRNFQRKAVLVWHPEAHAQDEALLTQLHAYRQDANRIHDGAILLCERLGLRYIEVRSSKEASHYLSQLL